MALWVLKCPCGSRRVQDDSGGFVRVFHLLGLKEGLWVSWRVWEGLGGSGRVQEVLKGLGGSGRVFYLKGLKEGLGMFGRVHPPTLPVEAS